MLKVVEIAAASDTGKVRDHNEDRALARAGVLAVADGMGGAKAGEVAAQIAIDRLDRLGARVDGPEVIDAIERANEEIVAAAASDPDKSGMGTTITVVSPHDGHLRVAHVGDSRAYLWRDGHLRRLTNDHSVVAELVRQGTITEEEAESHPHRNVITRALGAEASVSVDSADQPAQSGDVILVCSDGLTGQVRDTEIAEVMRVAPDLETVASQLVERANDAGGIDNVTVVLGRLDETGEDAPAASTAEMPAARAPRRGSRVSPVALAIAVLLALAVGGTAWLWSRSFTVQEVDGEVAIERGIPLPLGIGGQRVWQRTGVPAEAVNEVEPASLGDTALGRGEAVLLAARLVWEHGVPDVPTIARPEPTPAPSTTAPSP